MWCGTFAGISMFDNRNKLWKQYTSSDGLIDSSVAALQVDGNYIWLGTDNGIGRYDKIIPEVKLILPKVMLRIYHLI